MDASHKCQIAPWAVAPGEYYSAGVRHARCPECGKWWECYGPSRPWMPYLTAEVAMRTIITAGNLAKITKHHEEMGYPAEWLAALHWALAQPVGSKLDAGPGMRSLEFTGTMVVLTGHEAPHDWLPLWNLIYKPGFLAAVGKAMGEDRA